MWQQVTVNHKAISRAGTEKRWVSFTGLGARDGVTTDKYVVFLKCYRNFFVYIFYCKSHLYCYTASLVMLLDRSVGGQHPLQLLSFIYNLGIKKLTVKVFPFHVMSHNPGFKNHHKMLALCLLGLLKAVFFLVLFK